MTALEYLQRNYERLQSNSDLGLSQDVGALVGALIEEAVESRAELERLRVTVATIAARHYEAPQ